jgi:hypothetical protein
MTIRQRAARPDDRRGRADSATLLNRIRFALVALLCGCPLMTADLHLNDLDYFEAQGLSVLAYQNTFHEVFSFSPQTRRMRWLTGVNRE